MNDAKGAVDIALAFDKMREDLRDEFGLTQHAAHRMQARGIGREGLEAALAYGREIYARGARIFALGRKEVARYARFGINLEPFAGIQVVVSVDEGSVITVYRNHDFSHIRKKKYFGGPALAA